MQELIIQQFVTEEQYNLSGVTPSVVLRARHCGIPTILPSMSLKNALSAGLQARPQKLHCFYAI